MMTNGGAASRMLWASLLACCITPCNAADMSLMQTLRESYVDFMFTRDNPVYNLAWLLLLFSFACLWDWISSEKCKTPIGSKRIRKKLKSKIKNGQTQKTKKKVICILHAVQAQYTSPLLRDV
jgi:hypothetical protein